MLRLPGGIPIPGAIDRDLSDGFTGHIGADQFPAIPRLTLLFPTIFDFQQESSGEGITAPTWYLGGTGMAVATECYYGFKPLRLQSPTRQSEIAEDIG